MTVAPTSTDMRPTDDTFMNTRLVNIHHKRAFTNLLNQKQRDIVMKLEAIEITNLLGLSEKELGKRMVELELEDSKNVITPVASPPAKAVASTETAKPVKDIAITDPNERRLLINIISMIYNVQQGTGGLPGMLSKAKERHDALVEKSSSFLKEIAPGSTTVRGAVEGHGTIRALSSLFGLHQSSGEVNGSSEIDALVTVWAHQYKKEYLGTHPEMTDIDRQEKFESKKKDLIKRTASQIAEFGAYTETDSLEDRLFSVFEEVVIVLKGGMMAP